MFRQNWPPHPSVITAVTGGRKMAIYTVTPVSCVFDLSRSKPLLTSGEPDPIVQLTRMRTRSPESSAAMMLVSVRKSVRCKACESTSKRKETARGCLHVKSGHCLRAQRRLADDVSRQKAVEKVLDERPATRMDVVSMAWPL